MAPPRILLVDDDVGLLRALDAALASRMCELAVDACGTATEALERVAAADYDVVVTDVQMPGMDGLALLAEIRALRPETPVLLITGFDERDMAVRALRAGAFDFIQKPVERDYFVASLRRALQVRALSRRVSEQQRTLVRHANERDRIVQERTAELRDANRGKDDFLATLAHELRNPLAPIRNAVQIMRLHGTQDPMLVRAREIIERQVSQMARLIDDLVDVSRIHRGRVELRRQQMSVSEVIQHAIETCTPFVNARGHVLSVSLPTRDIQFDADPTRVEQIVANLLNNAAKYTEPGGRIGITAGTDADSVVIRVRDTGVGIAPDMLEHVFDMFTQADRSLDRSQGGLGIGLTLVRHLVELHGGTVTASSPGLGRGSEFTVRFPAATGDSFAARENVTEASARSAAGTKRVLIVEDNADSRETLHDLLRLWGHCVEVAEDGAEGVRKAIASQPEVAIVDIGLPGISGYDVAQEVRKNSDPQRIFLIALTGYGQPEDRRRALEAGFDAHLLKPVDLDKLSRLLAAVPSRS